MGRRFIEKLGKLFGMETTGRRALTGVPLRAVQVLGFVFSAFFIYSAINGATVYFGPRSLTPLRMVMPFFPFFNDHVVLPLYLFFTSVLIFLLFPASGTRSPADRPSFFDWIWCLVALGILIDYITFYEYRGEMAGEPAQWNDVLFGTLAVLVALETCRRVLGNILPALALLFLLFDWAGPSVPLQFLAHKGQPLQEVLYMSYGAEGMFGIITRVFANVVFLFIVFGAFLQYTKVGDVFIDLAFAIVGRSRGGSAKAAVVSSGLVGSVVGSGAANIAITGTFTIPLMKKGGYRPEYAGAVEAVASIGGHLMPPVMGSSVFLMAALTEVPYSRIIVIAFVPALLYYISIFASTHFYACRHGLTGLKGDEIPKFFGVLRKDGFLLLPVVVLIALLLAQFSAFYSAFWSLTSAIVCYTVKRRDWYLFSMEAGVFIGGLIWSPGIPVYFLAAVASSLMRERTRRFLGEIAKIFVTGATNSLVIGATAGVMGIVIATVSHSGLGLKFPQLILSYSFGYLWLALLLTAVASYFLGMGMTIGASYILIVILAGPALQDFGVPMIATHLIVYWLSQDSALTPPFALGAFVAAGIAQSDPMRTGFVSLKLAKPLYLVPIMMAYAPAFLMTEGTEWPDIVVTWVSVAVAFVCSAAALEGFLIRRMTIIERFSMIAATVLLMWYSPAAEPSLYWTKFAGLFLLAGTIYLQRLRPEEIYEPTAAEGALA